jgi:hypothetical protein
MFESPQSPSRVVLFGYWSGTLLSLLLGAGCFQPDEGVDDGTYPAWNPPLLDAASSPVLGSDAMVGAVPPLNPDAGGGWQAFMDAGWEALAPGPVTNDATSPISLDGSTSDASPASDGSTFVDVGLPSAPPTELSFSVLTKPLGGRYAPRNIGAIWIENASGGWIKTLAVWAFLRERHLTRFRSTSGGNRVDAVTSATLSQHTTHSVSWDLRDATGAPVPDGDYRLVIETTDKDATGDSTEVAFTKGLLPVRLMPLDVPHYVNMSLALE